MKKLFTYAALLALLFSSLSHAEIYQITDSKGNKTYTNIAPKADDSSRKVEKVNVRETNTTPSDGINNEEFLERQIDQRKAYENSSIDFENELAQANKALRDAETELAKAKEVTSGDYFNIPGKGMRYKDSYTERVQQAEENVAEAKKRLRALRSNRPSKNSAETQ